MTDKPGSLWQQNAMRDSERRLLLLDGRLIDDLYVEAMVLADEARDYLEHAATRERELLDPLDRVHFSCESLKVTTRLMQVIAWLLSRRALARREISEAEGRSEKYRLGEAAPSDPQATRLLPMEMRGLIAASESLYQRTRRLEDQLMERPAAPPQPATSPARDLIMMLETAF